MTEAIPLMTALNRQALGGALAQRSPSSGHQIEALRAARLVPATQDDFRRELTATIALCMPTGFSEDDRAEWLRAAWGTLNGIPADLLALGCAHARRVCDHPAKVVPAIMREVDDLWAARKRGLRSASERRVEGSEEQIESATPEQIASIKAEFGIATTPYAEKPKLLGEPRKPTREDYIALGVDPTILDRITGSPAA